MANDKYKQEYDRLWNRITSWPRADVQTGTGDTHMVPPKPARYFSDMSAQEKADLFQDHMTAVGAANIGTTSGALTLLADLFRADHMPARVSEAITSREARDAIDSFVEHSSIEDIDDYAAHPEYFNRPSKYPPTPAGKQVVSDYTQNRFTKRVGDLVLDRPISNLPSAVGIFLRTKGYNNAADYAKDPRYFWGAVGLLALAAGGAAYGTYRLFKRKNKHDKQAK